VKSKAEIEAELQNVIKDMEIAISENGGFTEDDEFIAHLVSRRDSLAWVLE
jgi:hypothetical protein